MSFEFGGGSIDPDEFNRIYGSQGNDSQPILGEYVDDIGSESTDPFVNGVIEGQEEISFPDPAELAELFDTLTAFNRAEEDQPRLDLDWIADMGKGVRKKGYEAEGMTSEEAAGFIEATEGKHAPEAEAALLDIDLITLRYQEVLDGFGISIVGKTFRGARAEIVDPVRLTTSLSCIFESNLPSQVRQGLDRMLGSFTGELWADVINNNGEQVDAYGAIPFWMQSGGYRPKPEVYARIEAMLAHGQELADQCERLGIDVQKVRSLRDISRYYQEGMIVEWALSHEMGFDEDPYEPKGYPLYEQSSDNRFWNTYFRMMDGAEAKSQPGDTFIDDQRRVATVHATAYLGKILGHLRNRITREEFNETWPNRDALEMAIAENMHDPYIAELVGWRSKLQQYGSQNEQQI